jgi:hypothetical protein
MPHQVFKATVKGSKGDLAHITAALHAVNGPNNEKVNIRYIAAGESSVVNGIELGVITMILEPDDGAMENLIITAIQNAPLDNGRHVEDVSKHPNVQVTMLDVPGSLNAALAPLSAASLNILTVLPMGSGTGVQSVGLGFADAADETAARQALSGANVIVHPPE